MRPKVVGAHCILMSRSPPKPRETHESGYFHLKYYNLEATLLTISDAFPKHLNPAERGAAEADGNGIESLNLFIGVAEKIRL